MRTDGYLPIEEYAAIGDSRALALVGIDGAIDWLCAPQLDSPSLYAALLDPERGGSWVLRPSVPYVVQRRYIERTNVLETTFETQVGSVRVTDALTIDNSQAAPWGELVRRVEGVWGNVPMSWEVEPRFDYGRRGAAFHPHGASFVARCRDLQVGLVAWDAGETVQRQGAVGGQFEASPERPSLLVMVVTDDQPLPIPTREAVERRLRETVEVWRSWVTRHTYEGPWREAVERSLLSIRLLADGRTGAIAAAGTTSLPETIGGKRNYDYRFGWVRDLCFTLDALLAVDMHELTQASLSWLLKATLRTHPRIDPVYSLKGHVVRDQARLPMPGYRGTGPVHVGNQAGRQLQLGGFGDAIETISTYVGRGHLLGPATGERLADIADLLTYIWRCEDSGLWELDTRAHYGTSKLGVWVAFERLLDLCRRGHVPARHPSAWERARDQVRDFIETRLYSEARNSYLLKAGSDGLDCGMLLAARRRFSDPAGERVGGTIDAIRDELHAGGPLLYRYSGMQEEENAFLACSFWLVEAMALAGRLDDAGEMMEDLVGLANDVGLYSEEMDPTTHAMRGNFPQALTHLSVVSAADALSKCVAAAQTSRATTGARSRPQSGGSPSRT